ncbi:MAG: hypothetical protein ACOCUR_02355 [Nanoarchaeota archaeon]
MLNLGQTITFYKRRDIQDEILFAAENKEIAVKFGEKGFGKRPDILKFPNDILEFAVKGATSFHASEELWYNPLQISTSLKPKELDELRMGWDLVIDIDCAVLEYSGIAADLVIEVLKYHDIESISCKFSGNHGFHIGVPFESFPESVGGEESRFLFPKMPKAIALYIKKMIEQPLAERIAEFEDGDIAAIAERTGKIREEIVKDPESETAELNVESFLEIDTILISSRHLYRMPYSFNEKSGLVSIPVDPSKVREFKKEDAVSKNVVVSEHRFLDRSNSVANEASRLSVQALDFISRNDIEKKIVDETKEMQKRVVNEAKNYEEFTEKIPEELFPPCINLMKEGMEDGKKRALFALVNFLTSVGWNYDDIDIWLRDWNKNNEENCGEGIRETLLRGQLRYHSAQKKAILPPNCDNPNYYKSIGTGTRVVCQPDSFCKYIKNPVQYAKKKMYFMKRDAEENKPKKRGRKKESEKPAESPDNNS